MNELVVSLVTAAFAWWCAMDDAEAIAEGRKIRHGLQWCMRAAWVLLWCGLFDAWLLALPLAFLFSGVFRVFLNRLRGLDVRYISDSNEYDWLFIAMFSDYKAGHHRAGTIAYVFEALAYGAGLWYV